MRTLRSSRLFSVVAAGLLACATGARAQGVFGVVEVDSWDACSSNLAIGCQSASLPFMLTSLNGMAGGLLRAPNLTGIDLQRPIRLYLLLNSTTDEEMEPTLVTALPLTGNGAVYRSMLTNSFNTVTQICGVLEYSEPGENALFESETIAVLVTNGVALTGETATDVAAVAAALRTNGVPVIEKMPADIRVAIALPRMLPLLEQGMAEMRDQMQAVPVTPGMADPSRIVACEMDAARDIMRQIKQLNFGIKVDATSLTLLTGVHAQPGSTLAAFLREQRPPSERYTRILPSNTVFGVVGGGLAGVNVIARPYGDFMAKLYAGMPGMTGMGSVMQNMITQCMGLYTGDYAIGMFPDARSRGVVFAEVLAVSDPVKIAKLMNDTFVASAGIATNIPYGISITSLPVRVYGGGEVRSYQYRFDTVQAGLPTMAFLQSFLSNATIESALVGKDMVVTFGRAGAIDQMIDRVRQGGDAKFYQNAIALFGNRAMPPTEVSHFELTGAIPVFLPLLPSNLTANLPPLPPPGKGGGSFEIRQGDAFYGTLKITTSEISALMQTVPLIMMSMQSAQPAPHSGGRKNRRPVPSAHPTAPGQTPIP